MHGTLEPQVFYGRVVYRVVHEFRGNKHILSFVDWAQNVRDTGSGYVWFRKWGLQGFVDAHALSLVGMFGIGRDIYVIEKVDGLAAEADDV